MKKSVPLIVRLLFVSSVIVSLIYLMISFNTDWNIPQWVNIGVIIIGIILLVTGAFLMNHEIKKQNK